MCGNEKRLIALAGIPGPLEERADSALTGRANPTSNNSNGSQVEVKNSTRAYPVHPYICPRFLRGHLRFQMYVSYIDTLAKCNHGPHAKALGNKFHRKSNGAHVK